MKKIDEGRVESRKRSQELAAMRRSGKDEVGTSEGGVNTAGKADRLTKTVQNRPSPINYDERKQARTGGPKLAKQSKPSMPDVRSGYQAVADYQKSKTIAPEKKGLTNAGGTIRKIGTPTRGGQVGQARADATRTVGQAAQRQREADMAQKAREQGATKIRSTGPGLEKLRANQPQTAGTPTAPKPAPQPASTATPSQVRPQMQPGKANQAKAALSRAALPQASVAAAVASKVKAKTGGQTVNKGTSKAPIANPRMKQMQQQRVGNWKNAETVSSYRKRMSMKEQRIWNLIESNETEPLKDKVVDKVKKEKKSAGKKGTTEMGGPTDIIDTEPQKTVQVGQQSR